jgi:MoaA/NifB/PqqE/SkfB family radical SAM enzyme
MAAFAYSEAEAFLHGDWLYQCSGYGYAVSGHYHLCAHRLTRIARDTANELGKRVTVTIEGENTEIVSVDGPEAIHDSVRGVNGSYKKIKENIALINELEIDNEKKIGKSICFTISRFSYRGLGEMPDVVRDMGINSVNIVPYYYFPEELGKNYEKELDKNFNCKAFSWRGFHHEDSGIDFETFREQLRKYKSNLNEISDFPYMPLSEEEYKIWFNDSITPVGTINCMNVEKLIDIQPDGDANFCVDFPDYTIGNVKESSIKDIWDSTAAVQFRTYRRENPLPICYRCGAKYMSEIK